MAAVPRCITASRSGDSAVSKNSCSTAMALVRSVTNPHYFTAPIVSPWTKCFRIVSDSKKIGIMTMIPTADIHSH